VPDAGVEREQPLDDTGPQPGSYVRVHCVRVREGGQVLQTVDADRGCFACTLGGAGGRTLYVVTAQWPNDFRTPTGQVLAVQVTVPSARSATAG
jgi:sugar lactone lactonase YvrE